MTADFMAVAALPPSVQDFDPVILDHGLASSFSAAALSAASAAGAVGAFDLDVEYLALADAATPSTPSERSAPSMALPCGSRIPDFSVR